VRIAEFVEPEQEKLARLMSQIGVTAVTTTLPGDAGRRTSSTRKAATGSDHPWSLVPLRLVQRGFADLGLEVAVVEDSPPMTQIRLGLEGQEQELEWFLTLVRSLGELGIGVLCFNFMAGSGWTRTNIAVPARGGALVSAYDHEQLRDAPPPEGVESIGTERMWENLEWFLERAVPVAEDAGVRLALHPDDPPLSPMRGIARIQSSLDDMERAVRLASSPSFGVTFCQGNVALMTQDVPAAIRRFASLDAIHFVHFRDVRGTPERFVETFQDDGPTDMAECVRAYRECGVDVPLRVDHVATLEGDSNAAPGYSTLARLWAVGYTQGLLGAAT
jgi:mannonate dehydratase